MYVRKLNNNLCIMQIAKRIPWRLVLGVGVTLLLELKVVLWNFTKSKKNERKNSSNRAQPLKSMSSKVAHSISFHLDDTHIVDK